MTVRFSASAGEESLAKKASTNTLRCGSVKGRRKAAATNRAAKARTLSRRFGSSSRVPASRSMWRTILAAVSNAPRVVASSHALETEMPRANPWLLSSGGNGVCTVNTRADCLGMNWLRGMISSTPCGGFQRSSIEARLSFHLKKSSAIGTARPPSRRKEMRCSFN